MEKRFKLTLIRDKLRKKFIEERKREKRIQRKFIEDSEMKGRNQL